MPKKSSLLNASRTVVFDRSEYGTPDSLKWIFATPLFGTVPDLPIPKVGYPGLLRHQRRFQGAHRSDRGVIETTRRIARGLRNFTTTGSDAYWPVVSRAAVRKSRVPAAAGLSNQAM